MSQRPSCFVVSILAAALVAGACTTERRGPADEGRAPPAFEPEARLAPPAGERRSRAPVDVAGEQRMSADTVSKATARTEALAFKRAPGPAVAPSWRAPGEPVERESYAHFEGNFLKRVAEHPVSTFSIDVDTGAYANVRRWLNQGRVPPQDAVRVEELINYFDYDYAGPDESGRPFAAHTEIAPAPWNPKAHLLRIGIKGYEVTRAGRAPANLVFLIDVSGSMRSAGKLALLKPALKLLARRLDERDHVAIVVYAGASGVALEPTPGDRTAKIEAALDGLAAGGSTNGGAGIRLAYSLAEQSFKPGGINRVILATDGDFNVGTVDFETLKDLVERKRASGVALTTLGFGGGNYNDHLMEQLADAGNGNHAYIDTLNEARKVLAEQMTSTLQTIAKDVKIQVEFNPAVVAEYRLIGYENRALKREDFNNDRVDAGEIGAGHTVTALYEIALAGSGGERIESLRYGDAPVGEAGAVEMAFLRMRYKQPDSNTSELIEWSLRRESIVDMSHASADFRFAAAVAAFGQILRGGRYTNRFDYEDVAELARGARGPDRRGYRGEFLGLVSLAEVLDSGRAIAEG